MQTTFNYAKSLAQINHEQDQIKLDDFINKASAKNFTFEKMVDQFLQTNPTGLELITFDSSLQGATITNIVETTQESDEITKSYQANIAFGTATSEQKFIFIYNLSYQSAFDALMKDYQFIAVANSFFTSPHVSFDAENNKYYYSTGSYEIAPKNITIMKNGIVSPLPSGVGYVNLNFQTSRVFGDDTKSIIEIMFSYKDRRVTNDNLPEWSFNYPKSPNQKQLDFLYSLYTKSVSSNPPTNIPTAEQLRAFNNADLQGATITNIISEEINPPYFTIFSADVSFGNTTPRRIKFKYDLAP